MFFYWTLAANPAKVKQGETATVYSLNRKAIDQINEPGNRISFRKRIYL
jgi:hypothetical protein